MKARSPDQTAISVSLSKSLLADIDRRAEQLGLSRSQFLAQIARTNIDQGGPLVIAASNSNPGTSQKEQDLIGLFIHALKEFEKFQETTAIAAPEPLADTKLWERFQDELEQISRHKWTKSQEAGYDIGHERAIRDWLQQHHALWSAARDQAAN